MIKRSAVGFVFENVSNAAEVIGGVCGILPGRAAEGDVEGNVPVIGRSEGMGGASRFGGFQEKPDSGAVGWPVPSMDSASILAGGYPGTSNEMLPAVSVPGMAAVGGVLLISVFQNPISALSMILEELVRQPWPVTYCPGRACCAMTVNCA